MKRVSRKFKGIHGGTYFLAGKGMTEGQSLKAAILLRGIHYVKRRKEGSTWSVYIMDKKERNTY